MEITEILVPAKDHSFPYEFYKSYFLIKTKIVTPSDTQAPEIWRIYPNI